MTRWLVWYTDVDGRGDSVEVDAPTKDEAADYVLDHYNSDSIDNVELISER